MDAASCISNFNIFKNNDSGLFWVRELGNTAKEKRGGEGKGDKEVDTG